MLKIIDIIKKTEEWVANTRKNISKFFYALIISYIALFLTIYLQASAYLVSVALLATLIIPFAMVVMILTKNKIHSALKKSLWGKSVISIIITLYGAMVYIWASGEVNRIFVEAPEYFPWTISILIVVNFFKNIVLVIIGGFSAFLLVYVNYWVLDVFVLNFKDFGEFTKRIISGILLVLGVGLSLGTAGIVTQNSEKLAKIIAVKADFNQHHSCQGKDFFNIDGVIFLTEGYVLIAKPLAVGDWNFKRIKCTR